MKTNLSSQITLTRIPLRYYRPENAFEHSVLTRLEKIPTNIYESAEEGSFAIAKEIATQIRKKQDIGKPFVIALPGGRSPLSVYKVLIRMHKEENLSFRNVIAFVEYEFYPLANPSAGNLARLKEELFDQVDIDPANIYCPDVATLCQTVLTDLFNEVFCDCVEPAKLIKSKEFINAIIPLLPFKQGKSLRNIRRAIVKYVLGEG